MDKLIKSDDLHELTSHEQSTFSPFYGINFVSILKSSGIMIIIFILLNFFLSVFSIYFLEGDVLKFLSFFFLLESGVLFILSGLYAFFGTSPSLNLLIGKLLSEPDRPLKMNQAKAIHRSIDYFLTSLMIFFSSLFSFKILSLL